MLDNVCPTIKTSDTIWHRMFLFDKPYNYKAHNNQGKLSLIDGENSLRLCVKKYKRNNIFFELFVGKDNLHQ